ncbi:MAG: biotin/lipoyl-containing protein, partial [Acidimicrobiia bacterium]
MATARSFALPDLGEGLEDAILLEWHVATGDDVALNQPLCTVETAKATVEIPSPFAGRVAARIGDPGDTILVGDVLVEIDVGAAADDVPSILVGYGPRAAGAAPRRRRRGRSDAPDAPDA